MFEVIQDGGEEAWSLDAMAIDVEVLSMMMCVGSLVFLLWNILFIGSKSFLISSSCWITNEKSGRRRRTNERKRCCYLGELQMGMKAERE